MVNVAPERMSISAVAIVRLAFAVRIPPEYMYISYTEAGAEIVDTPGEIFERSEMVMHVKEPQPSEYDLIRKNQIVFTYLHLAAAKELTQALIRAGSINIAYETIQKNTDGSLPLLTPMSEVAGRMVIQQGAK